MGYFVHIACAKLDNKEVFTKLETTEFIEQNERERTEEKMYKSEKRFTNQKLMSLDARKNTD